MKSLIRSLMSPPSLDRNQYAIVMQMLSRVEAEVGKKTTQTHIHSGTRLLSHAVANEANAGSMWHRCSHCTSGNGASFN